MSGHRDRASGPDVSFFILVALTTLAFLALVGSFLMPVFWAAVLAIVFFPLQSRYVERFGGRRPWPPS